MRLLFIADIFGRPGREAVESLVPRLREELDLDLVVANGENAADGAGITDRLADKILASGVDCITLGNHTWHQRGFGSYLDSETRIVRPANYLATQPRARHGDRGGARWHERRRRQPHGAALRAPRAVVQPVRDRRDGRRRRPRQAPVVLVDFHAEATSEKVAMGRHLAGRVTAVLGTHTHVQTNDASLWDGTAYLTDCGMTGPHDSVIGVRTEIALRRFLTQLPARSEPALGDVRLEGALVECDRSDGAGDAHRDLPAARMRRAAACVAVALAAAPVLAPPASAREARVAVIVPHAADADRAGSAHARRGRRRPAPARGARPRGRSCAPCGRQYAGARRATCIRCGSTTRSRCTPDPG